MMTKPIAILKDSLREAWDSKTLLVMLILSFLFLIGVASVGYKPAEPRAVIEEHFRGLSQPIIRVDRGKYVLPLQDRETGRPYPHPVFTVTTFRTLKEGSHPSGGEHEFTVVVRRSDADTAGKEPGNDREKDGGKKEQVPPGADPFAGQPDLFELMVAAWHEEPRSSEYIRIDDAKDLDPRKWRLVKPVTDDMIREFFGVELEREIQTPITGFEQVPTEKPHERVYKITTGPTTEPRVWPVKWSLGFGAYEDDSPVALGVIVYRIQDYILNSVGGLIIIMIAVIVTSFFIPNMLRPGSVVMLLSKPISRTTLLLFKYFGGLFFVLILASFLVGGAWLITGIRSGIWAPGIFAVVPLMTLSFAILYAVSTLTAVLTRNSIVAILVTLAFGGLLWLVGKVEFAATIHRMLRDATAEIKNEKPEYATWANVSGAINNFLPRWHDIDVLTGHAVERSLMTLKQQEAGQAMRQKHLPSWGGALGVTALWIAALLGLACWRFSTKDY
jgi:ABC-type transport system involved in multi-copper enzyme maturation permease subunit